MRAVLRDVFGHRLHLTSERRQHILHEHPELAPYLRRLDEVFAAPDIVKQSRRDPQVYLYYRYEPDVLGGKYLLGVAGIGQRSFVLTAYVTDTVKEGKQLWPRP